MFGWLISLFWNLRPVENRDNALNIAQTAIHRKWPGDYSLYEPKLSYDESKGIWHFRYLMKHEPGQYLLGGIGPGVDIRKSDGKITYLKGQK